MIWLFVFMSLANASEKTYTEKDLWDARCDTGCQRDHYHSGTYNSKNKTCLCTDEYLVEDITRKKVSLPKRDPGRQFDIYEGTNQIQYPSPDP
jgi:hypothetical protein